LPDGPDELQQQLQPWRVRTADRCRSTVSQAGTFPRRLLPASVRAARAGPGVRRQTAASNVALTLSMMARNILNHSNYGAPSGGLFVPLFPGISQPGWIRSFRRLNHIQSQRQVFEGVQGHRLGDLSYFGAFAPQQRSRTRDFTSQGVVLNPFPCGKSKIRVVTELRHCGNHEGSNH